MTAPRPPKHKSPRAPHKPTATLARVVPPLVLFAVLSLAAIVGLAWLPDARDDGIDTRTGLPARTASLVLQQARQCGDARAALDVLRDFTEHGGEADHDLRATVEMLSRELGPAAVFEPGQHPLRDLLGRSLPLAELLPQLQRALDDTEIAAQTELFFKATAHGDDPASPAGPDAKAARVLRLSQHLPLRASDALHLAAAFATAGRGRAHLRWLLRALAAAPDDARLLLQVAQTYAKDGRYVEALLLTGTDLDRPSDDRTFWSLRQQLATWLSQPAAEAQAIEALLAATPQDDRLRLRAVEVYAALGRSEQASAHATALAERSRELSDREAAARTALEAGDVVTALQHYAALAALGGDDRRARERIVEVALLDLDYDRAIAELEHLAERADNEAYLEQLESLYRRRDRAGPLAELLWRRFEQQSADFDLGIELLHLLVGLGQRQRAEQVAQRLQDAQHRPVTFFSQLPKIAATSALQREQSVEVRAAEVASSPELTAADLPQVLAGLLPLARQRRFKPTLETLAKRFGNEPAMQRFLLDLVQHEQDAMASAQTAQEVALLTNATDLVREWAKRAAWVGLADSERLARARLTELNPDDADNRQALAWMLTNEGQHTAALPHWRYLVEHGARGEVADAYVTALLRSGGQQEAVRFLDAEATRPDASLTDRLHAADTLLGANLTGPAAACYERVLALEPNHPQALLRLGQIKFWSNDPGGAVPLLSRLLALRTDAGAEAAPTHFALAQALAALGRQAEARPHYARALELLTTSEADDRDEMRVRCLVQLDRDDEAIALYRELLVEKPDQIDLRLDLVDLLRERGDHLAAGEELATVAARAPDHPRGLRARAEHAAHQRDFAAAKALLQRDLELHGESASGLAQLAYLSELDGTHRDALDAYRRWRALAPDAAEPERGERNASLRALAVAGGELRWRKLGQDEAWSGQVHGHLPLGERVRGSWHAGHGGYRGFSPSAGLLREEATWVGGQVHWQWRQRDVFAAGIELYPDTPGDDLSAFTNLHLEGGAPFWSFDLHAAWGSLWTEPAAAVALGGRRDGVLVSGYRSLGERGFVSGELAAWSAHVELGDREDTQLHGALSLGWRWTDASYNAVADRFRATRTPTGPLGPSGARTDRGVALASWLAFDSSRLLGGLDLPAVLPLGERFDYLMLASRADFASGERLGAVLEGFVGVEVHEGDATWGVSGAASYTPSPSTELTCGFGCGDALARQGAGSASTSLFLQLHVRW